MPSDLVGYYDIFGKIFYICIGMYAFKWFIIDTGIDIYKDVKRRINDDE